MHYKNGREAKVGDLVKGNGYNVKYEITGLLIAAKPAESACNCQVAHVGPSSTVKAYGYLDGGKYAFSPCPNEVQASIEYGQLDAFLAIDPATGEVLPPDA